MTSDNPGAAPALQTKDLLDAALACVGENGAGAVSVDEITRRCGLDESAFYRYFTEPRQCVERAYEVEAEKLLLRLLSQSGEASAMIEQALRDLAAFLAEHRLRARAVLIEARLAAGPPFQRRQEFMKRLSEGLDAACRQEAGREAPSVAGVFLVGGIEQLAVQALSNDRPGDFVRDIPGLVFLIGRTYGLPVGGIEQSLP